MFWVLNQVGSFFKHRFLASICSTINFEPTFLKGTPFNNNFVVSEFMLSFINS